MTDTGSEELNKIISLLICEVNEDLGALERDDNKRPDLSPEHRAKEALLTWSNRRTKEAVEHLIQMVLCDLTIPEEQSDTTLPPGMAELHMQRKGGYKEGIGDFAQKLHDYLSEEAVSKELEGKK